MQSSSNKSESDSGDAPGVEAEPRGGAAAASPPQVIRGESYWNGYDQDTGERVLGIPLLVGRRLTLKFQPVPYPDTRPYSAITDWLNFSFPMWDGSAHVAPIVERLLDLLGPKAAPVEERRGGMHRYEHAFDVGESGALFCFGGNNGTGLISLSGEACASVGDWETLTRFGRDELKGRITRWDGAVDDYAGDYTVDLAMQLWKAGKFGSGGNQPKMKQDGNWEQPDGSGRTIYIGRRKNGKFMRVYEKGMQLGAAWHPWVRWELVYGNRDRIIPWEVLTQTWPIHGGRVSKCAFLGAEGSKPRLHHPKANADRL